MSEETDLEIRDPIHGPIVVLKEEEPVVMHGFFQRLRNIKQLGLTEYAFPGAVHSRLLHSVGVMHIGERVIAKTLRRYENNSEFLRIKETFKLACLLHDVGHAPLSHSTEVAMPSLRELDIPEGFLDLRDASADRRATHEDYTIKAIADSSFTDAFGQVESRFGVERRYIADLVRGMTDSSGYFTLDGIDYFPMLHQLISSELDCDRMDYLLRDSYFCGVSYGSFDIGWLIENIEACPIDGRAYLGISERALLAFDDFLLGRYHMFIMVYFHYRTVCLEQLLVNFFQTSPDEYRLPSDIEDYRSCDDYSLVEALRTSSNRYARRIVENRIPPKVYESFNDDQLECLEAIQGCLEDNGIDFIRCSSAGRLSRYSSYDYAVVCYPIQVARKEYFKKGVSYLDLAKATDLFKKYHKVHAVDRLHFDIGTLDPKVRKKIEMLVASL